MSMVVTSDNEVCGQFNIIFKPLPQFDGKHVVFGRVSIIEMYSILFLLCNKNTLFHFKGEEHDYIKKYIDSQCNNKQSYLRSDLSSYKCYNKCRSEASYYAYIISRSVTKY